MQRRYPGRRSLLPSTTYNKGWLSLRSLKCWNKICGKPKFEVFCSNTLPETNSMPLKMDGWKMILSFWGVWAYLQVLLLLVSGRIFLDSPWILVKERQGCSVCSIILVSCFFFWWVLDTSLQMMYSRFGNPSYFGMKFISNKNWEDQIRHEHVFCDDQKKDALYTIVQTV